MSDPDPTPATPARRHLHPASTEGRRRSWTAPAVDLTRHHGQSNGLRVHGRYFAVISLLALVLVIVAIALAASPDM